MTNTYLDLTSLGQSGYKISFPKTNIIIDPYMSNSVELEVCSDFKRLIPINHNINLIEDVDWILITHDHLDHCDPKTLIRICNMNSKVKFIGPGPVVKILKNIGIQSSRIILADQKNFMNLSIVDNLKLHCIPAAHPNIELDNNNDSKCLGFLFEFGNYKIYHAGDTSVDELILKKLQKFGTIDLAFIPINEKNYFKHEKGIIGNMSLREAFSFAEKIKIKKFIPIHWDMFDNNSVLEEEIEILYKKLNCSFELFIKPKRIYLENIDFSIIIRTLNEEKYLNKLLNSIKNQSIENYNYEIIIVDSGSVDKTLEIAKNHNCVITNIKKNDFTFGRSLNIGCKTSQGKILIFISGHCIPLDKNWLINLSKPIMNKVANICYGKQVEGDETFLSERNIFKKFYKDRSKLQKNNCFFNNANSAILKQLWEKYKFNEFLTGLEDIDFGKRAIEDEEVIYYSSDAKIQHNHDENWDQIQRRFEREAVALKNIMFGIKLSFFRSILKYGKYVLYDIFSIYSDKKIKRNSLLDIFKYRFYQIRGTYLGIVNTEKKQSQQKNKFFY